MIAKPDADTRRAFSGCQGWAAGRSNKARLYRRLARLATL